MISSTPPPPFPPPPWSPINSSHLIVELRYAVNFQVFGPRHEPVLMLRRFVVIPVLLVDQRHAAANVGGALLEEAAVLLTRFQVDEHHRYEREPDGEGVVPHPPEAAQLQNDRLKNNTRWRISATS